MANRSQKMKGSCQLCGIVASTDPSTGQILSHEGPKSWSFMKEQGCPSTGGVPYQQSTELIQREIGQVGNEISSLRKRVDEIMNRPGNTVVRGERDGSRRMSKFELSPANKHIWTQETNSSKLEEAIKQYKIWEAYPIEKSAVELFGYEIWLRNQLKNWQPEDLVAGNDKESISALNKKRTAEIRSAKQEAKDNFDYSVQLPSFYDNVGDSLDEDWIVGEIATQRKSAAGVAVRIFSLPNRGIDCQTWGDGRLLKGFCSNLKDFTELFSKSDAGFRVACGACNEILSISHGEAACSREDFSHQFFQIVELSVISKALSGGTPLIHLYLQETQRSPRWLEVNSWDFARTTLLGDQVHSCESYCGTCKGRLTFDVNDLRCECERPSEIEKLQQVRNSSFFGSIMNALKKPFNRTDQLIKPISLAPDVADNLNISPDADVSDETNDFFNLELGDVEPATEISELTIPSQQAEFDHWFKLLRLCDVYHEV